MEKTIRPIRVLLGYLGIFLGIVGIMALIPLTILPFYPSEASSWTSFFIPGISCFILGALLYQLIRGKQNLITFKNKDAIIVVLSWTIALFVTAIPFYLEGGITFMASVFESASAWSTTGMTMLDVTNTSHILIFYRCITTIVGGVGIILIMLLLFSNKRGMRLYNSEGHSDKLVPNLLKSSKVILEIYLGYIVVGIILYLIFGMNLFDAFVHSSNAVSTSGFSNRANSLSYYNNPAFEIITILLMSLGALNFFVQFLALNGKFKNFVKYCENKTAFFICIIGIALFFGIVLGSTAYSIPQSFRFSLFHFTSAITTTGFTIMNVNWTTVAPALIVLLILIMNIGGCSGSTAGGIKTYRVYILARDFIWNIKQKITPSNVVSLDFVSKADEVAIIDEKEKSSVKSYVLLYFSILFLLAFIVALYGYSFEKSIFDVSSAFSSTGYSVGVFTSSSHPIVLLCGIIAMMLGRLEIIIVFVAATQIVQNITNRLRQIKKHN